MYQGRNIEKLQNIYTTGYQGHAQYKPSTFKNNTI